MAISLEAGVTADALTPQQMCRFEEIGELISAPLHRVETAETVPAILPWRRR
ncbi:hypothetical protein [Streptomyces sp. NPDC058683]|uniref:hypothetical protein n=1 Tax=Streptomyces sp. NPDC058683 TaxID=3346597 RepID=UPI00365DA068